MFKTFSLNFRSALKIAVVGVFAISLLAFGLAPEAKADSITYTLLVANPNLASQGPGPYGTIQIASVNATTWNVTATGLNNFRFGAVGAIALNINTTNSGAITLGTCSMSPCTNAGSGNNDGFGNFTFRVDDGPGFSNGGYSVVTFQFTTANAITGSLVSNLLSVNNQGALVSAHMALASNTACTGYAANAGTNTGSGPSTDPACVSTPEPNSLATAGIGVLGLLLLVVGSRRLGLGNKSL